MPFIRVDTVKGHYTDAQRQAIGEAIHQTLREIGVPDTDRFQVFSEKAPTELVFDLTYLGIERSDGFVAIQITLNAGRSTEVKKRLYATLADRASRLAGVTPGNLFINLIEVPRENWSFGNGEAQYAAK
jgi:4-oxalocrotonate tautomerase